MAPGQGLDPRVGESPARWHVNYPSPRQVQGPKPSVGQFEVISRPSLARLVTLDLLHDVPWQVENCSPMVERPQQAGNPTTGGAIRSAGTLDDLTHEHAGVGDHDRGSGAWHPHGRKNMRSCRRRHTINAGPPAARSPDQEMVPA